ncbi:hypothetical protein ACVGOW_20195 [Pseudonocardia saturnea]
MELPDVRLGRVYDMLVAEFGGRLDEGVVRFEVALAERELRGQAPPGAADELTHRLAAHRLSQRCAGTGPAV